MVYPSPPGTLPESVSNPIGNLTSAEQGLLWLVLVAVAEIPTTVRILTLSREYFTQMATSGICHS